MAPLPHTGDVLTMEMTRSLLQCFSGTVCSFPNILRCLKCFIYEHESEERLTSVIAGHLLPSQSRPELPSPTDPPLRHQLDTSFPSPTCSPWRETFLEWLIDCEAFEAVPQIEFLSGRTQIPQTQANPVQLFSTSSAHSRAMSRIGFARWNTTA